MTTPSLVIDIFNHVMPPPYLEEMKKRSKEPGMIKRMNSLPMLWDFEEIGRASCRERVCVPV